MISCDGTPLRQEEEGGGVGGASRDGVSDTQMRPLRDMAALVHLVAMHPSLAEIRIRVLVRCRGPLCSPGPAGDDITAGSCSWITLDK